MGTRATQISALVEEISNDLNLKEDLKILPPNYTFEVPKTIWKIRSTGSKYVALQFPEGLIMYACVIADILEKYTGCDTVIMGDVTYGACCVDDFTAISMGCDLLVHYGHSCLVPIQNTDGIAMLYVFVNIHINLSHLIDCVRENFQGKKLAVVSTVQFIPSLQTLRTTFNAAEDGENTVKITIPQCKPLSPGEVLGCTSPRLDAAEFDAIVYVGDGRFHLESIMIHNPSIEAFQYDPYSRKLTRERYDHDLMRKNRLGAVEIAKKCTMFGLIQGTLGRQGNLKVIEELEQQLEKKGKKFVRVLLSEIFPEKLAMFPEVDCWVQVACPRLSIDWGTQFPKPLLYPFELAVALENISVPRDHWPMDYYSNDSLGPWTNNNEANRPKREKRRPHIVIRAET
uniref:2-(3-amino-3-carboxypropyl)histidine synthase subunit 1 n=1 Tax=Caenorhabditis japonica TaxID=281687 RepID=A0A8R1HN21_CAEJA